MNQPPMRWLPAAFVLAFFLLVSCAKEVFPSEEEVVGHWLEKDATKSPDQLHRLLITATEFSLMYPDSSVNLLTYELEKQSGSILLTEPTHGNTAPLEISYRRKDDELGLLNLFVSIPEQSQWAWFEREE